MPQTVTYNVPDITCSHCVHAITSELQTLTGIESVTVDLKAKTVTVIADPLDEQAVVAAIDEAGYEVVPG